MDCERNYVLDLNSSLTFRLLYKHLPSTVGYKETQTPITKKKIFPLATYHTMKYEILHIGI